jgi:AcrR family transcriptional regulator
MHLDERPVCPGSNQGGRPSPSAVVSLARGPRPAVRLYGYGLTFQPSAVIIYCMGDSKAILLAAAADQFAKYGSRGTRVQDIVQAAGVNERMIYHHFGSKAGLYAAVMQEQRARLGEAWWPALEKAATMDPYAGMRLALGTFLDALLARPQIAALFVHEALGDAPIAVPEGITSLPEPVRALYERGQAEGVFAADVPFETAYAVAIGSLLATSVFAPRFTEIFTDVLGSDPARLRDQVVTQLLDGMTG